MWTAMRNACGQTMMRVPAAVGGVACGQRRAVSAPLWRLTLTAWRSGVARRCDNTTCCLLPQLGQLANPSS